MKSITNVLVIGLGLAALAGSPASAASCVEDGSYRKGRHIRLQARDRSEEWHLNQYVYRIENMEPLGNSYETVSNFRIDKRDEDWLGYFHIKAVKSDGSRDTQFFRCDFEGQAKRRSGLDDYTDMKFSGYECYNVSVNNGGTPIKIDRGSALPISVSCERNYTQSETRLTVKLSFSD